MVNRRPRPQELTPAELEIMQILWDRESAFVNDILAVLPDPKPASRFLRECCKPTANRIPARRSGLVTL